jgi:hypothetical protein
MVRYYKIVKKAQVATPLDQWVGKADDQGNEFVPQTGQMPTVLDWDMTPEEAEGFLADDYIDEDQATIEQMQTQQDQEETFEEQLEEPWDPPDIDPDVPIMGNTEAALKWAIENRRTLKIFYKTKGYAKSRTGRKLKREIGLPEGATIQRVIEPHHMFQAKNGNKIVVTWDRSVWAIRAFIVSGILSYSVLAKGKRNPFKVRPSVLPSSQRGIGAMENIQKQLKEAQQELSDQKLVKTASVVKDALQAYENFRIAQYVGIQGYWIRNRRCWDNCYRHKRATKPGKAAQEVWTECWDEYKKSINDDKSGWERYAEKDGFEVRYGSKERAEWDEKFAKRVEEKVKGGLTRPEAVYATIEEESGKYADTLLSEVSNLMEVAATLKEAGYDDLAEKLATTSDEMLKSADFQGNPGGFLSPVKRLWQGISDKWTGKGGEADIKKKIQDMVNRAYAIIRQLEKANQHYNKQGLLPSTAKAEGKKFIEAAPKKGKPVAKPVSRRKPKPAPPAAAAGKTTPPAPTPPAPTPPAPTPPAPTPPAPTPPAASGGAASTGGATTSPAPSGAKLPKSFVRSVNSLYDGFVADVEKSISEFSGYMSSPNQGVKGLAQTVFPALQEFRGKARSVMSVPAERKPAAMIEVLNGLIDGLTGAGGGMGLLSENAGQSMPSGGGAPRGAPSGGAPAAPGSPASSSGSPYDVLNGKTAKELFDLKVEIDKRLGLMKYQAP